MFKEIKMYVRRLKKPNRYTISVVNNGDYSSYNVEKSSGGNGFFPSDLEQGAKIYLLVNSNQLGTIQYIGQTIQSIRKRFYPGIRYQKYLWAKESGTYSLFIWDVRNIIKCGADLDCLESELVFATRVNQGVWPVKQTSIKFRWFRGNVTKGFGFEAPRVAIDMMNDIYSFLLSNKHLTPEDIKIVSDQKTRMQQLLNSVVPT